MMLVKVFRRSGVVLALWACAISGATASNGLSDLSAEQAFEKGKLCVGNGIIKKHFHT
ncbi:hypothetical protein [Vibrio sp. TRT 17S01]|uniref:hypothetical protein n=1 Tax=Vibrio sp. TRT 17S01 TaxID=3418505 RepID=UPI003CF29BC7